MDWFLAVTMFLFMLGSKITSVQGGVIYSIVVGMFLASIVAIRVL